MNGAKPKQLPVLGTQDQLMTDMMAGVSHFKSKRFKRKGRRAVVSNEQNHIW